MRARVIAAALALATAVTLLVVLNVRLDATALPIEMERLASLGDSSAAEGLTVDYRMGLLNNKMRWYTEYAPADGTNGTEFAATYQKEEYPENAPLTYRYAAFMLSRRLLDCTDPNDPIVQELQRRLESSDSDYCTTLIYPINYYDYYTVAVSDKYWMGEWVSIKDSSYSVQTDFPLLRIPVGESDFAAIYCENPYSDGQVIGASLWQFCLETRFTPYTLPCEGGELMTVGFAADAQPQPEWAPEGFGLWYVPKETQHVTYGGGAGYVLDVPVVEKCRLVYPLDIQTQRVVQLTQSEDGAYILLVTVEEEQYVLHVLDSSDYHLVQRLALDSAETSEGAMSYYMEAAWGALREPTGDAPAYTVEVQEGGVQSVTTPYEDYLPVSVRQFDGNVVVILGSRFVLLTPAGEGYHLEFTAESAHYSYTTTAQQPEKPTWSISATEELRQVDEGRYEPYYDMVTAASAMCYDGQRLAVASYGDEYGGTTLLLSVYTADGLQYAEVSSASVTRQSGRGEYYWEALWPDELQSVEDWKNWIKLPSLRWAQ